MATKKTTFTADMRPKTLLLGVYTPFNKIRSADHYFEEFISLVETLDLPYDETLFMKLRNVEKNTFLTKGKMQEFVEYCDANKIEQVVVSEILSPLQERNLEDAAHVEVFDREQLILNIFKKAATTSEGKIQIEMAEIEFSRTRLLGKGKEFAQQAGYIGGKGPGETISEEIRQHYAEKLRQAKKRLETLQQARDVQRKLRMRSKTPQVCIIGYTNAGKSSLLNRLTRSDVLAENKLFATLDTTTRELYLDASHKILISDTVGFISQLPHKLIEAFKSTLDELQYASLLLQVVDASNPAWEDQMRVVQSTLDDLGVDKPMIYVFNKIDKLDEEQMAELKEKLKEYKNYVLINTLSKEGVEKLFELLKNYKF